MRAALNRRNRLYWVLASLFLVAISIWLIINALSTSLSFFVTPSEIHQRADLVGKPVRLGGLIAQGSIRHLKDEQAGITIFSITDGVEEVQIKTRQALPNLFTENNGTVVEGVWTGEEPLWASKILARHDENYMPAEAVEALKRTGQWRGPDPLQKTPEEN